jgi:hypothetical protein
VITGRLGSTTVFTITGTVPNIFGNIVAVPNLGSTGPIDSLLIQLSNPQVSCCANPIGLDNIVVTLLAGSGS